MGGACRREKQAADKPRTHPSHPSGSTVRVLDAIRDLSPVCSEGRQELNRSECRLGRGQRNLCTKKGVWLGGSGREAGREGPSWAQGEADVAGASCALKG